MLAYRNLIIIGTSHIAKQSLEEVRNVIETEKPDIIALELDKKRYVALTTNQKSRISLYDIKRVGLKGFLFSLIGTWAEKKLGNYVGVAPGSEMLVAIDLAKKNKAKMALIDQDIEITLRRFSKTLSWKERWRFLVDIFNGVILRKKDITFDLTKVPEKKLISKLIGMLKKRYPNVYKTLIEERNDVMAQRLTILMKNEPDKKIVAVVGAGHEDEIIAIIKKQINKVDISYSFSIT